MNYKKLMGVTVMAVVIGASAAWAGSSGATNTVNNRMDASLAAGAKLQAALVTSLNSIVNVLDALVSGTNVVQAGKLLTVGALSTTGDVTIAAGALADGSVTNADIAATANIAVTKLGAGGLIPANSAASLTNIPGANITGNIPMGSISNAFGLVPANFTVTNVIFNSGATTADWVFINGLLSAQPE